VLISASTVLVKAPYLLDTPGGCGARLRLHPPRWAGGVGTGEELRKSKGSRKISRGSHGRGGASGRSRLTPSGGARPRYPSLHVGGKRETTIARPSACRTVNSTI
jgi:hypothetical protein